LISSGQPGPPRPAGFDFEVSPVDRELVHQLPEMHRNRRLEAVYLARGARAIFSGYGRERYVSMIEGDGHDGIGENERTALRLSRAAQPLGGSHHGLGSVKLTVSVMGCL
jgi:aldehyde:ferredoxin oxidoreductase